MRSGRFPEYSNFIENIVIGAEVVSQGNLELKLLTSFHITADSFVAPPPPSTSSSSRTNRPYIIPNKFNYSIRPLSLQQRLS